MTNRSRSATSSPADVVTAALARAAAAVAVTGLVVVGLAHLDGAPNTRLQARQVATEIAGGADAVDLMPATSVHTGPAGPSPAAADAGTGWVRSGPAGPEPDDAVAVDAAASGLPSRLTSGAPEVELTGSEPSTGAADASVPGPGAAAPTPPPSTAGPAPEQASSPDRRTTAQQPEAAPEHIERIVRARFGDRTDAALRVAHCESRYDPSAVSAGGGSWGLFQINRVHEDLVAELGYQWEDLLDPAVNTHVARVLFDRTGGWSPWACAWAAR